MSWSLEAALVVPVCSAVLVAGVLVLEPLYQYGRGAARLEVTAIISRQERHHVYQVLAVGDDRRTAAALAVSPGRILLLSRLLRDDLALFLRTLPGDLR